MSEQDWRQQSGPHYTRIFELYAKAEDNGLTDDERQEMEDLDQKVDELFREFLASRYLPGAPS